jgi:hypothetical protein
MNLFPWSEIEPAFGDGDNDFTAHDLAFDMGIAVIFAGSVVPVCGMGVIGNKSFEPCFIVMVEAGFIVIDDDTCRNMHGVDKAQTFLDAGFSESCFDFVCNIKDGSSCGDIEIKDFSVRFHGLALGVK